MNNFLAFRPTCLDKQKYGQDQKRMVLFSKISVSMFFIKARKLLLHIKFIYSEKATKFCEIFPLLLTTVHTVKSKGEDFAKICGLLRIYELYKTENVKLLPSNGSISGSVWLGMLLFRSVLR